MSKALLFDLDGTLLPMDTDEFVKRYMMELAPHVKNFMDQDEFLKVLWEGTHAMVKNTDPTLTNEKVFINYFVENTGIQQSDIWPVFDRFYTEHFSVLQKHTTPLEISKEIVQVAKEQGRKVVIATNPVFPKAAIYERLNWLGLLEFPFDLITVYEESHFCKPQPNYFKEILEKIEIPAEDAVMIGNDMQEDMVASQLGIKTYLITDNIIDRGKPSYQVDQTGTLKDLLEQLKAKEGIFTL